PYLLRKLGLVHDLQIPIPAKIPTTNTVQVLVTWMPVKSDVGTLNIPASDRRMETRCHVSSSGFYALHREIEPEIIDRMLPLEDKRRYEVVTVDAEGSAIKMLDFASGLAVARSAKKTDDTPAQSSVPALRTGGISVVRIEKAEQTHKSFIRQDEINQDLANGADITLNCEDITRGFAIDIWDSLTREWHSLCQRAGKYEFLKPDPPIVEKAEDQGWVSGSVTSAADDSTDVLKQGESLFHWNGWSLSAPRPGKTLDADGKAGYTGNEIDPAYQLAVDFKTKNGSLPRLRYGAGYRVRARAVDLAGNRLSMKDKSLADDRHATEEITYGRFEPVPPPVTVMRRPITEGESVNHVVIRSNYDQPFEAVSERHILPPKISQTVAEEHAMFDYPDGLVGEGAYKMIVPREAGVIIGEPDPDNHNQPYVNEDNIELPYLPDVFARRAVLQGFPGVNGPYQVSFGYSEGIKWPDALPFRLVLGEADVAKINFNESSRVLEVLLPKAEVARLRLSSAMEKDDAVQMGLVQWLIEAGKNENATLALAVEGRHWMLTPWRNFTLVHAVRQPLLTPEFNQLFVSRSVDQTFATIQDRMARVSRKSTVKLDVTASWQETIDPIGEPGPKVLSINARPFEQAVTLAPKTDEEERFHLDGRHEFGDTRYRRVTYSLIATTRFAEYFRRRDKTVRLSGDGLFLLTSNSIVEGSETVRLAGKEQTYRGYDPDTKSGDYVIDYEAGAIRRTGSSENPGSIPENQDLEITFIETPVTRSTENPRALDILSSARPAAPKVLYIVPTFAWSGSFSGKGNNTVNSQRLGGSLRIYLERPWYTSGDGELLAAIIWPGPDNVSVSNQSGLEKIRPFVTQWGMDPLFRSKPVSAMPTLGAFKLSKSQQQATGLLIEEVKDENYKVNVAGHTVGYDSSRKLWYCDMQIDAGSSYFPFVRLALARYQPNSLFRAVTGPDTMVDPTRENVHLSRVVLADFAQLAPDRFASISRDGSDAAVRHVSLTGFSYSLLGGQAGPATVEASLEKRREGIDPMVAQELAWEPVDWNPVVLASTANKDGSTIWTGDITLPDTKNVYRLLIKEYEVYSVPGIVPIIQRRMVYVDAIELAP
ncbi:MAG: hypothetical protein PHI10_05895, partial [Dehalococcoidales bacterium]|nr:hypothetical protein [Dehalococcoidales bacterium]